MSELRNERPNGGDREVAKMWFVVASGLLHRSPVGGAKKARHDRRVAHRKAPKEYPMTLPMRMVHTERIRAVGHPTWDRLFEHVAHDRFNYRRLELNEWVRGLLLRPDVPQPALLLAGPACGGKTTFRMAMGLLLPPKAVVQFPPSRDALRDAWVMHYQGYPGRIAALLRREIREERYLKWILDHDKAVEPLHNVRHFNVLQLRTTVPRSDLLRRLEDEADDFRSSLTRLRAAA